MNKIKKISALILSLAMCLAASACQSTADVAEQSTASSAETSEIEDTARQSSDAPQTAVTEAEAKAIAEGLLKDRVFIEYEMLCAGLKTDNDNVIEQNGLHYAAVTDGYTCTDDLKAEITSVFTADYIENSYYMDCFGGNYPMYIDVDGVLYMNIDGGGGGYEEYAYDNMVIEGFNNDEISGYVPGQAAYGELIKCSFTLSSAEGSWKISAVSVTYGE